jgi:protein phosphatase
VVSEETLHRTLATVASLDDVVLQLIELAIRGGGPDNITCIVADVVDSATAPLPPSDTSVVVGAASNGSGGTHFRTDTPAGRAHLLTRTAPHPAVAIAHDDPAPPRAEAAESTHHRRRRRLPLVKSALVILLILVVGGAYAGWRYTQSQYYVAANGGTVVIYRGINENVAGMSLNSVAQRTTIPVAELPRMEASDLQATITSPAGLAGARNIVTNLQAAYQHCHNAYIALHTWQITPPQKVKTKVNGRTVTKEVRKPRPVIPADCPAQPASTGNGGT